MVDPAFAIEPYLDAAARRAGVRIVRVLETHTHADHVSGHGRFALEHGVPVSIHPLARPEYPFDPLADGQVDPRRLGRDRRRHTPGHRPEHCAFVVAGELVLTGDSMFVGEAARPDLAVEAREGAADLLHSLHRLAELPDAIAVYPGHVSGSLCGTNMSDEHSTTIGREKVRTARCASDERDVRRGVGVADDAAAADDRALRRAEPRPVGRGAAAARPARRSRRGDRARRAAGRGLRRGPRPRRDQRRARRRLVRDARGVRARPGRAVRPARALARPRRPRRRGCCRRSGCSSSAATSLEARRDRDDADRHRGRARAAARRRPGRPGARRARAERARRGATPGRGPASVPRGALSPRRRARPRRGRSTRSARAARARRSPRACSRARASTPARRSAAASATSWPSATRLVESR